MCYPSLSSQAVGGRCYNGSSGQTRHVGTWGKGEGNLQQFQMFIPDRRGQRDRQGGDMISSKRVVNINIRVSFVIILDSYFIRERDFSL